MDTDLVLTSLPQIVELMKITNLQIPARDGFQLAATRYVAAANPAEIVIVNSATGVKRAFYDRYARFLAEQGFEVITFDYRGIGDSRPVTLNKFRAFMHDWGELDIAGVIAWARREHPEARICAVGHSVGGQVMGLAANNGEVAAMVLVASQSGYWRLWPWHQRYFIFLFWYGLAPISTALASYFPAKFIGLGEDLPAGVAFEWASWGRNPRYLMGANGLASKINFRNFKGSILSYSVAKDFFAPPRSVDELVTFYSNANSTRKHLTPQKLGVKRFGHFDFFRERFRDSLWRESVAWLRAQS